MLSSERLCRFAITGLCLAALAAGIVWNGLYAVADLSARRNQPDSTRLAMRLMPANAAYPGQLAQELYASDPQAAKSLLQKAVNLVPNPRLTVPVSERSGIRYDQPRWALKGLLLS